MEVKPGYKQTEVGVIPDDWEVAFVEDIAHITTGAKNTQDRVEDGDYPFFVRSQTIERINSYSFDGEAVLTAGDGVGTGKVFHYINGKFDVHQRVYRMSGFGERASGYFFFLYFSNHFYARIMQMTAKSSVDSVRREMIARMKIPLPPTKAEQEAIAGALSDADALIESLELLVAKKRQIKHGAMQQLLTGQKRLPGFTGEWETKRLGEIGEALIGLTYKPTDVREHGVLVLRSSNVFEGGLRFEDNVHVEMAIPEKIMVKPGDILICVRNGSRDLIGKCAKIDDRAKGMTFGAFMAVFRTPFHDFIYYQFQSDAMHRQIHEHLGATINQITNRSLNSFQVPLPPDEAEQQAIAKVLADMGAEIAGLESKLAKARQVKQGMMQELLTGRIRLVSPQREGRP
jgi:type I restriction enzyme, S subunit